MSPLGRMPVRRIRVVGSSMEPALANGDVVVAVRGPVRAGDVVVVTWDDRPGQVSVKRAQWREGDLWVVYGDNVFSSTDSRTLGPARVHAVVRWRLGRRPWRLFRTA